MTAQYISIGSVFVDRHINSFHLSFHSYLLRSVLKNTKDLHTPHVSLLTLCKLYAGQFQFDTSAIHPSLLRVIASPRSDSCLSDRDRTLAARPQTSSLPRLSMSGRHILSICTTYWRWTLSKRVFLPYRTSIIFSTSLSSSSNVRSQLSSGSRGSSQSKQSASSQLAGFLDDPGRSSPALAGLDVPMRIIGTEYPKLPAAPRVLRIVPLPGMVLDTYVPAFGRILL